MFSSLVCDVILKIQPLRRIIIRNMNKQAQQPKPIHNLLHEQELFKECDLLTTEKIRLKSFNKEKSRVISEQRKRNAKYYSLSNIQQQKSQQTLINRAQQGDSQFQVQVKNDFLCCVQTARSLNNSQTSSSCRLTRTAVSMNKLKPLRQNISTASLDLSDSDVDIDGQVDAHQMSQQLRLYSAINEITGGNLSELRKTINRVNGLVNYLDSLIEQSEQLRKNLQTIKHDYVEYLKALRV